MTNEQLRKEKLVKEIETTVSRMLAAYVRERFALGYTTDEVIAKLQSVMQIVSRKA